MIQVIPERRNFFLVLRIKRHLNSYGSLNYNNGQFKVRAARGSAAIGLETLNELDHSEGGQLEI